MKSGLKSLGFTIVETMIFLGVSSAILVSALTLISGAQRKTQFNQGIRDAQQQLNDVIDNVSSGYTGGQDGLRCIANGNNPPNIVSGTSNLLGESGDCIVIGKVIQFGRGNTFDVYTVVGRRKNNSDNSLVKNLDEARPQIAVQTKTTHTLKNGITVETVKKGLTNTSTVGFFNVINPGYNTSNGSQGSGVQQIDYVTFPAGISGAISSATPASLGANALNSFPASYILPNSAFRNSPTGVTVCMKGDGNQIAKITIGGTGNNTTDLRIENGTC